MFMMEYVFKPIAVIAVIQIEWNWNVEIVFSDITPCEWAHVRCKTNNNILLIYIFVQDANDSFAPCFAFVLCIMTSAVPSYMDYKPVDDDG